MKKLSLTNSLIPVIVLIVLLAFNVFVFGDNSLGGSNQFILLIGAAVAMLVGLINKFKYEDIINAIANNIKDTTSAILILLLVGSLAGTWMLSGIIPSMIYYGLEILNPTIFLVATVIIAALISIATGSSWTTSATVGIALVGIGKSIGLGEGIVAGAVISGAYFGDKISPMSDTTNLAAAIAGTDLYTHIKYMLYTTSVSIIITLIIFFVMGLVMNHSGSTDPQLIQNSIKETFNINVWLLVIPVVVIVMILLKTKPLIALFTGILLGAVAAIVFQPNLIAQNGLHYKITKEVPAQFSYELTFNTSGNEYDSPGEYNITSKSDEYQANLTINALSFNENKKLENIVKKGAIYKNNKKVGEITLKAEPTSFWLSSYFAIINTITQGSSVQTNDESLSDLFSNGGMAGMLNTIWLIICAMAFGGAMEAIGALNRISEFFLSLAKSIFGLYASTVATCIGVNVFAADQYLSIVVPGKMYQKAYKDKGLAPENLSRTLEDAGTVTSVLIPWNTCGAYQSKVLLGESGITSYIPYAFFNILSPFVTLTFALFKIKIKMLKEKI